MTWKSWLDEGAIERLKVDAGAIEGQLRAARRSLSDASLPDLSPEGRFQLAYDAVLVLASAVVLASGYRIRSRIGHHQRTLEAVGIAMGDAELDSIRYFDLVRRKRNTLSYEGDEVGAAQASELLSEAEAFQRRIMAWLETREPT